MLTKNCTFSLRYRPRHGNEVMGENQRGTNPYMFELKYEVNIPSSGLNLNYYESDTADPSNKVHDTAPVTDANGTTWPNEDQLHHFAGYFWSGAKLEAGGVSSCLPLNAIRG